MTREDYDRYAAAFNARDYDALFAFYADRPQLDFFGIRITTRDQLRAFYGFLHQYVRETITVERFAASAELVAVEGVIRIEGIAELTRETLDARGMQQFAAVAAGEVQELRQYIHYHLAGGRIVRVGCTLVP